MMQGQPDLTDMQRYIANVAITPSALRNLGPENLVRTAKEFLAEKIDLRELINIEPSQYASWLEGKTQAHMEAFRDKDLWGPVRKSINIFMVMASLNRSVSPAYNLDRLKDILEVPLDNRVVQGVLDWATKRRGLLRRQLPKWESIKKLKREDSEKFQALAEEMAKEQGISKYCLDVVLWPERHGQQ